MPELPSPANLRGLFHEAYHWLCRSRKKHPPASDIWDFRRSWAAQAETRWKLKKAIRVLNRTFGDLKLAKHPDKTAMGRVTRGFDFLGYHLTPTGLSLAAQTLAHCAGKALRLYEQEPPPLRVRRLGEYLSRWHGWALSGGLAGALADVVGGAAISPIGFCGGTSPAEYGLNPAAQAVPMRQLKGPVLIYFVRHGFKHFAVFKRIKGDRVYLADPARGNIRMSIYHFQSEWPGYIRAIGKK
jgi:hypothetical protein